MDYSISTTLRQLHEHHRRVLQCQRINILRYLDLELQEYGRVAIDDIFTSRKRNNSRRTQEKLEETTGESPETGALRIAPWFPSIISQHWRQTTAIERTPARAWHKTTERTLWTGTPRLAGVTIYNSNSDCEWRRRTFKQSLDSTRWAESEVNEDELEREAISNVDNDNTLELRATSDNRTELRLPTAGVSTQSFTACS